MPLTMPEKNAVLHHFNENLGVRRTADGQSTVDAAHSKLSIVKSNTIVSIMNSHTDGIEACSRAAASLLSTSSSDNKLTDVRSCAVVTVLDSSAVHDQEILPIRAKMARVIPGSVQEAPELFSEVLSTVLGRTAVWKNATNLQAKLYAHVYSGGATKTMKSWTPSADGTSVSMRTPGGLVLKCALLRSTKVDGSAGSGDKIKSIGESDHRFAQRVLGQGVTQSYSQQPMEFTARLDDSPNIYRAVVYPCSSKATGLFVGTMHASGFERPLKACAVVASNTMLVHPQWGVHEADATVLMAPYTRSHVSAVSSMFVKSAIMRAVMGSSATVDLGNLDEPQLMGQYKELREMLSPQQLESSMDIWNGMHEKKVVEMGNTRPVYGVTCVGGTVDSFKNDAYHTGLALHTRSIVEAKFAYNHNEFSIKTPLVVSMYGTYYHPW
ncbi:hypothetical protein T484DRAFT_1757376 [Baffinella frigidus]|nr:hypothetical protein T484DRAFT_1757376 [Cryptophyta sp. CCMP2293]